MPKKYIGIIKVLINIHVYLSKLLEWFSSSGSTYSGYEAAVYSAASSYYQQQQQQQKQAAAAAAVAATAAWSGSNFTKKTTFQNKQLKPKQPPKPPQIHYCDVCKISCAGPQVCCSIISPSALI